MNIEEVERATLARLAAHASPVIEWARLPRILDINPGNWWYFTQNLPASELPAMFQAGGARCLQKDEAERWVKGFIRKYPKRCGVTE